MTPFNLALHEHLMVNGCTHERVDADWEDDGDGENGPHLTGHPDFDVYEDATDRYVMRDDGDFYHEVRDLAFEEYMKSMP